MIQPCKLCGHATAEVVHPKFGKYYFCSYCEYVSKDKQYILSEDQELEVYNLHRNSIDDPGYVEFFYRFLNDAVFPYVGTGKAGLDFGSGPSPVLAEILERHHGYEMDIYDLFYAPDNVHTGQKYNLITSTEVVEHLEHPITYFEQFAELLRPDGILAIMTLFHHNEPARFLNWHYMRDDTHISFYTPQTMRYIADRVGLSVIHTDDVRYTTFMLEE